MLLFRQLTLFQDKTWLFYCDMSGESQKYLPRKFYKMLIVKKNYKSMMVKIKILCTSHRKIGWILCIP